MQSLFATFTSCGNAQYGRCQSEGRIAISLLTSDADPYDEQIRTGGRRQGRLLPGILGCSLVPDTPIPKE
jgi:hypothetical protein